MFWLFLYWRSFHLVFPPKFISDSPSLCVISYLHVTSTWGQFSSVSRSIARKELAEPGHLSFTWTARVSGGHMHPHCPLDHSSVPASWPEITKWAASKFSQYHTARSLIHLCKWYTRAWVWKEPESGRSREPLEVRFSTSCFSFDMCPCPCVNRLPAFVFILAGSAPNLGLTMEASLEALSFFEVFAGPTCSEEEVLACVAVGLDHCEQLPVTLTQNSSFSSNCPMAISPQSCLVPRRDPTIRSPISQNQRSGLKRLPSSHHISSKSS